MIVWVSAASFFHRVFGVDVCMFLCAFRLRAKTADMRNLQYLPHENVFFEVVLLRCRRGEGEENDRKTHAKTASKIMKILCFFHVFVMPASPAEKIAQNDLPEPLRDPPRGAPGRVKSINFSRQDAPGAGPMFFFRLRAPPGPPPRAI